GWHGTRTTAAAFCKGALSESTEVTMHSKLLAIASAGVGRHGCVGSKQHGRKDARSHHANDAPSEEHRTGSIRICAWSPQAEVQVTISISIYAESSKYPDYNWHAHALKTWRSQRKPAL